MSEINLESLGFKQEEIQERVIDQLCEQLLNTIFIEYEGTDGKYRKSAFNRELDKAIKERMDATINTIVDTEIRPKIHEKIENIILQKTNDWGEPKDEPITFTEYLIAYAEKYMVEMVDGDGKTREQTQYTWSGKQSRIVYLIDFHLHGSIKIALKQILKTANDTLVAGLKETVEIKLNEINEQLKQGRR